MDKESRSRGTNNYKGMGIMLLCLFVFAGIILLCANETLSGVITIVSGISLFFIFMAIHSICYRLDLIIDKK